MKTLLSLLVIVFVVDFFVFYCKIKDFLMSESLIARFNNLHPAILTF